MPDTVIDSVGAFIAEMAKLQQIGDELRPVFWFRGHAKVCWKLLPGVLRDDFINRVNELNGWPNDPRLVDTAIESAEKSINDQFRREGAALLQSNANRVDVYFLAQHYDLPTRLLDWTANPLAALFFAVSQEHDHDGEVISILPDWRLTFGDESNPRKAGLPYPPVGQRDQLLSRRLSTCLAWASVLKVVSLSPSNPTCGRRACCSNGRASRCTCQAALRLTRTPRIARDSIFPAAVRESSWRS